MDQFPRHGAKTLLSPRSLLPLIGIVEADIPLAPQPGKFSRHPRYDTGIPKSIQAYMRIRLRRTIGQLPIMTGGQSADPKSPHFTDQADGYINGKFKNVLFYKADVLKHAAQTYHPGAEKK